MVFRRTVIAVAGFIIFMHSAAHGHHSFAVEFTREETATITGVVEKVWFRNPHVRYFVNVTGSDGEVVRWDTRGNSPSQLVRKGWTKNTIVVGDTITIKGYLGRDDEKLMSIINIVLADGTKLGKDE